MRFDLHCHSTASDGKLSPREVVQRVKEAELDIFSLTDHDTIAGYDQLDTLDLPFQLINGIELSCVWSGVAIHIIGLDFEREALSIQAAIARLRRAREERAVILDQKLTAKSMPNVLETARQYCSDMGQIGRPHFAQAMVDLGYVSTVNQAFDRWLGSGKIGDVKTVWPSLFEVVESINEAGGVAVLAHPLRYKMTFSKLKRLITAFKEAGGHAVEVVGQQADASKKAQLVAEVQTLDLAASGGADFHNPEWKWAQIGEIEPLPESLTPVWNLFKRTKIEVK